MYNDIVVELLGNNLLYEFTCTLKEADRPICLCQAVVQAAGLVEDNDGAFVPGVGATVEGDVEDVSEGVRSGSVGLGKDAVSDSARAWHHGGGRGFEGRGDFGGGDGCPVSGGARWRVGVLDVIHWEGCCREEAGLEDVGLEGQVVDQGAISGLEGWEGFDLSSVAGLGKALDVTVFDGLVESLMRPRVFCLAEGLV